MSIITCRFIEKDDHGFVKFNAKYDEKYYKKFGMNFFDRRGNGLNLTLKDMRYINFSDNNGFVLSKCFYLPSLCRKRPRRYWHNPRGFDHTTYWRMRGDKFPSFCLTEPYSHEDFENLNDIELESGPYYEKFNLKFKVFEKSEKSLWYPNSTSMIFWWDPDYFDFEKHQNLLMSHEDAKEIEKKCEIIRIKK